MMKRPYDIQHSFFAFFWKVSRSIRFFTNGTSPFVFFHHHFSELDSAIYFHAALLFDPVESIFLLLCLGPLPLGLERNITYLTKPLLSFLPYR